MRFVNIKSIVLILIILVLLWLIKNIVASILTLTQNSHIVTTLSEQEKDAKKRKQFLEQQLYYVQTPQYIENEAREKLGLVKPGEHIVLAPPQVEDEKQRAVTDSTPTWKKWWNLFF